MNKNLMKTVIKALPIIAIFILLIAGTYSRYSFASTGDTELGIAGWNVTIKSDNKDLTLLEETQTINLKVENNPYVVKDKIAPGVTAVGTIDVDLTGTEVAVDITIDVDKSNLTSDFEVVTKLDGEILNNNTKFISLENDKAFTTENGKKTITVELTWKSNAENIMADSISIPVRVIVEQHID